MSKNSAESQGSRFNELIETSAQIFAEKGFKGTSIQDIGREMGWTSAAIYYYVKSKDDILYEIWRRAGVRLQNAADEIAALPISEEEKVRLFFHRHIRMILSDRATFEVLVLERSRISSEGAHLLEKDERKYMKTFTDIVKALRNNGANIREPNVLALGAMNMLNGVIRWYKPNGRLSLDQIADTYCNMFLHGVYQGDAPP